MIIQNKIIYLSGIVMTYFLSELLKTSPIIHKNPRNVQKYERCVNVLSQSVHYVKDVYNMCDTLHVVDDSFNNFTCDLVHLLLYCYALVRNNLHRSLLGADYWFICNASVIIYSFITQCKFFEFSYSSTSIYTTGQVVFNAVLCLCLLSVLFWQVYQKRANIAMLLVVVVAYLCLYAIIWCAKHEVYFHFHHVFVCTILLCFFGKLEHRVDGYMHAILIGIIVQGFSFFTVSEIFIFSTDNVSPPTFQYILCLFVISFALWTVLKTLHMYVKKQKEDIHIHEYQII